MNVSAWVLVFSGCLLLLATLTYAPREIRLWLIRRKFRRATKEMMKQIQDMARVIGEQLIPACQKCIVAMEELGRKLR